MNSSFPKYKEKRPRSSASENSNSFVKNVTSRVSGLLPATITKWFSSPSSSSANGSAPTAEVTDSSTEDEGSETPVVTQPPAKRMRFNTSNKFNHFGPTETNCTTNNLEITEIPVSHFPGTPYSSSRNNVSLTQMRSPIEMFNNEPIKDKLDRDSSRFKSTQHTVSKLGQSVAAKRKSIFDRTSNEDATKPNAKSPKGDTKRPCFKPTLLGSPFYPGSTIYGGAASSYVNQPNIQQHTVALVNESKGNDDTTMSSSARRVMDLLETYSSPLMEARRIPHYTKPKMENFYSSNNTSSPYENRSLSYKTQELNVPSIASILRLKQRSRLMDSTKAARQIIASHSSASTPYPLTNSTATASTSEGLAIGGRSWPESEIKQSNTQAKEVNKMTTKVKARVTRTNRGQDPFDTTVSVQLPSATLQIDQNKLPTFSFSSTPVTSTPKVVNPVPKIDQVKSDIEISTSKSATDTSSNIFKFSNPVQVSCDTPVPDTTPPKFTFDSPERRIEQQQNTSKTDVSSVVGNVKETDKTMNKTKDWQCPECWVNNKSEVTKCVCCGHNQQQKAVKAAKCVVCKLSDSQTLKDKCVNCEKMASPSTAKPSQTTKWKCEGCWIMNDDSVGKCPCCGESKPNEVSKAAKAAAAAETAAFPKVKAPSCGGGFTFGASPTPVPKDPKPLQLPSNSTTFFGSSDKGDSTFVSLAKTQKSDKWECSSCLVMNASHEPACVCCAAERYPKSKLPESKFGFALNTNTSSFKFGIDPKVQEATLAKKPEVQLTPESKLKRISETNNNVLPETPTFTFSLPAKKAETKVDAVKDKPLEPVKFSFGVPANINASANLSEPTKSAQEDNEKLQEVPQVKNPEKLLAAAIPEKPKSTGFFATPLTQQVEKDKPLAPTSSLFALPTVEAKKDISSSIPITLQPAATSVEKPPTQSPFALKLATNLFAATTTASSSSSAISFTSPGQSTVTTASASNISQILPVAPMQKTEAPALTLPAPTLAAPAVSVPALPAPAASTSVFSFGTNGVNNPTPSGSTVASAEKPNLQFTFGSNNTTKTDSAQSLLSSSNAQPVFKSLFAPVSVNNAKNTNTFSLTSGNSLISNNALTSNTLSGSNGISATNGLVGNTLSGNSMGGNGLSGNMLSTNTMASSTFASNSLAGGNGASSGTLGGTNGLPGNTLAGGSGLQPSNTLTNNSLPANPSNIFVNVQKENMWNPNPNNNTPSNNLFTSNTTTNSLQKPAAFTFGTSTQFNATSPSPAFGSTTQPAPNIFGMASQNNSNQPSLFSSPVQNQTPAPMFGSPQPNNNPVPQMGMFGTSSLGATPAFGAPSASINSFETASMTPAPAPAFTFGAQAQTPMFGFGQQQSQQQQDQSSGVYSFGSTQPVQFNMGTATNTASRRIRKAARRTQR